MAESKTTFSIRSVDDDHESQNITDTLNDLDGVMAATIADGEASVRYDEDVIGGEQVEKRVRDMGYETE